VAKDAKDKKAKGKGKGGGEADAPGVIRLSGHPRAQQHIAKAKGWGGLIGFFVVGWLSYRAGVPLPAAGLRAIAGGAGLYVLAWAAAVAVWREVAVAEVERARRRMIAEMEAAAAAAQEQAKAQQAAAR
jgi:hypothetical protein